MAEEREQTKQETRRAPARHKGPFALLQSRNPPALSLSKLWRHAWPLRCSCGGTIKSQRRPSCVELRDLCATSAAEEVRYFGALGWDEQDVKMPRWLLLVMMLRHVASWGKQKLNCENLRQSHLLRPLFNATVPPASAPSLRIQQSINIYPLTHRRCLRRLLTPSRHLAPDPRRQLRRPCPHPLNPLCWSTCKRCPQRRERVPNERHR